VLNIITIRDEKVILDVHLAELYEVETRVLKQSVRRNRERFPADFMYELTNAEIEEVVSQNVILKSLKYLITLYGLFSLSKKVTMNLTLNQKKRQRHKSRHKLF
jgi:hypothetical protein